MLKYYTYRATPFIIQTLQQVLEEEMGGVLHESLSDSSYKAKVRIAESDYSVVLVVMSSNDWKEGYGSFPIDDRFLSYNDERDFISQINDKYHKNIPLPEIKELPKQFTAKEEVVDPLDNLGGDEVLRLKTELKLKNALITNLSNQLREIDKAYDEAYVPDDSELMEKLRKSEEINERLKSSSIFQEAQILKLKEEVETLRSSSTGTSEVESSLRSELESKESIILSLREHIKNIESTPPHSNDEIVSLEETISELESELKSVKSSSQDKITQLNVLNVKLTSENAKLKEEISNNGSNLDILSELGRTESEINRIKDLPLGTFIDTGFKDKLSIDVPVPLYNNIKFIFDGVNGHNKESLRVLLKSMPFDATKKWLIVDITGNNSYLDYVFKPTESSELAYEWFNNPNTDLNTVISQSKLTINQRVQRKDIYTLSLGLITSNQGWLLNLDWLKILDKLNSAGFDVIFYAGNIVDLVGKYLYEFVTVGNNDTTILVKGSVVSLRNSILSIDGLNSVGKVVTFDLVTEGKVANVVGTLQRRLQDNHQQARVLGSGTLSLRG